MQPDLPRLPACDETGRDTPRFWRFVTTAQWEKALEELRHFGDQGRAPDGRPVSSKRREDESKLWKRALAKFPKR